MSESEEEEEESFCFYGKPLEPYDEDAFPKKKPVSIEDQIATDSHGRRRFHGAFTGGFSAGFFNTVGSLEGWRPSEFKSSRADKAQNVKQKPQDFMDDEDVGEFGFAPEQIRATNEFNTSKKRSRIVMSDGPIPGVPVLESLITCGNDTVGYLLLKNIGLRDKIKQKQEIEQSPDKIYGCEMPSAYEISRTADNDKFVIPDVYKQFLACPKDNDQGLGYSGLDKSNFNLFQSTKLVVHEKNKKLSISGQAFGVGAFENDDEDIYSKDNMSNYDFELTGENKASTSKKVENKVFDLFVKAKNPLFSIVKYPPPNIPYSFTGKHKIKKSRFQPVVEETQKTDRKNINPSIRAKYLGEAVNEEVTASKEIQFESNARKPNNTKNNYDEASESENAKKLSKSDLIAGLVFDKFVSASQPDDHTNLLETVTKSENMHGTKEMRDAAKMKMFGPLTRATLDWSPCALLCKRFNVPEPHFDGMNSRQNRKRTKHLIFEYEKHNEEETVFKPGLSTNKVEETDNIASSSIEDKQSRTTENIAEVTTKTDGDKKEQSSLQNVDSLTNVEEALIIEKEEDDRNRPKDITEKINVDQNMDLFKAIFLSSDEEEPDESTEENSKVEDSTKKPEAVTEEMKANILSDDFVPKFIPKIKTNKEGILSNLDFIKINKFSTVRQETTGDKNLENTTVIDDSIYGPKIPVNLDTNLAKSVVISSDSDDGWVEMDRSSNSCKKKKSHKHKKKHKKEHKKKTSKHTKKTK